MEPLIVKSVKMLTPPNFYTFVWTCPCGDLNGTTIELGHLVIEAICVNCGAKCEIQVEWKNESLPHQPS